MHHLISFSGGRTSAYMVFLIEKTHLLENVEYIYMDTGAEHPATYEFIRNVVKHFNIKLTCLRAVVHPEMGKGNTYEVISIDDIKPDLKPWKDMLAKYSTPYLGGAFCTDRMKVVPFNKYCIDKYGKGNYTTWLGIRTDEKKRLKDKDGIKYLADLSDFDKKDVLDFWKDMPFDLNIPEWLGNCVFCLKKGINRVALACKDEPELAKQFIEMLNDESVRDIERKHGKMIMYRGMNSLASIVEIYKDIPKHQIIQRMRGDTGACNESCEVFICDK